ncbi:hypothetical protein [Clostridium peptidivorans]|uniref:hypothetical protein n=1 Tax=Clostridium peptidivorans TaxID=100174 RepID=UPI000BE2CBC0|nr:hypothetical protein [Clostridium peptidivorans]
MKSSNYKISIIKFILSLLIIIYMSYNIYVNINYIIYYKNVISKNKSLYSTLINNTKHKEENCSEILEKISKEKNCILSKVTKDDSKNVLEVNVSYIGKLEELKEFILKTSKEKNFQDIKYIHIYNNIPKVQSELHITFKI